MLSKFRKSEEGFTLIELLIVVAIIGILAAIAIPQFAQYRIRGYNSSSQSDVRNLATSQAAFFGDYQGFGVTESAALPGAGGTGAGGVLTGPAGLTDIISGPDNGGTARGMNIGLGNGVGVIANTSAPIAPAVTAAGFTAFAKHTQGDTFYAMDSDVTATYFRTGGAVGVAIVAGDTVASTNANDDLIATYTVK